MKRAALLARNSTENQRIEETIQSQVEEIKQAIQTDGNIIISDCIYIDEGYTGELLSRPEIDKLRDDAKSKKFDILYVYDRGRISRKFAYQEIVIEELQDLGIEFKSLHDSNGNTPEEKVMQAMQGVFHEYERVKIAERFRRGKLFKVKSGKLLGYNPPYGYCYVKKTTESEGQFIVNEQEAEVVKKIFDWIVMERLSILGVVRKLHDAGIPPRKNKREAWSKSAVARLVRNESYIGNHYYLKTEAVVAKNPINKYHRVKKSSRINRPKDQWYKISIPPIIEKELFDKAQKQLEENSRYSPRNTKREYLLQGLIYCPCGSKRTGEGIQDHIYYRCTDRLHKFPLPPTCTNGGINAKVLDGVVWKTMVDFLENPKIIKEQADRWLKKQNSNTEARTSNSDPNKIRKQIETIKTQEDRFSLAYGKGIMSLEIYEKRINELKKDRESLLQELTRSENESELKQTISPEKLAKIALNTIQQFDFSDKKYIVRQLIEKVTADNKTVVISGHIPLKLNLYIGLSHEDRNSRVAECWEINSI